MNKTILFTGGMITGAVALPVAIATIKPVREGTAKLVAKGLGFLIVRDPEVREAAVRAATSTLTVVKKLNEEGN